VIQIQQRKSYESIRVLFDDRRDLVISISFVSEHSFEAEDTTGADPELVHFIN